jgi:hypothetical protein
LSRIAWLRVHLLAPFLAVLLFPAVVVSAAGAAPAAGAAMLSDSTQRQSWRLENGLEVRTIHVPRAAAVSVTVAYRAGSGYDPADLEGLSELLAELQWTCAAGPTPERTRDEITGVRPLGWESRNGARLTRFTEIVTAQQLPGVLQEAARRMAGVTVTDADVKAARASVRRDLGRQYFGDPADALYWRTAALAHGADDPRLVRMAGVPALEKLAARDVSPWLKRWYQPGNASLAIVGDLAGLDIHALVGSLFGPVPGVAGLPDTVEVRLSGAKRHSPWKDLSAPLGSVAVLSPPLADSLHPGFYLGMLVTGPALAGTWGPATLPLTTRFQYSLLDEPELVRFYPPVTPGVTDPDLVAGALYEQLHMVSGQNVPAGILVRVKRSVRWLLGSELPSDLVRRLRTETGGLGTLSNGAATRALWKGDEFWAGYLARFDETKLGHNYFYSWITQPEHQSILLLTPER